MYNLVDLTSRKIIVAGASSGIGKQAAITLSKLGANVILLARRENLLQDVMHELEGDNNCYYCCDLSNTDEIGEVVKKIVSEQGPVDGLAYIAGRSSGTPIAQFTPKKVEDYFRINYFGFVEFVRQISRKGRFNPGLRIVAISSIAAACGDPALTAYAGSKAAIDGSIRCMAKELASKGICINSVAPAMTNTPMFAGFNSKYGDDSDSAAYLLKRQYLGIGEPEDIANAISFLISPAARFITGTCLYVDGGYTSC